MAGAIVYTGTDAVTVLVKEAARRDDRAGRHFKRPDIVESVGEPVAVTVHGPHLSIKVRLDRIVKGAVPGIDQRGRRE